MTAKDILSQLDRYYQDVNTIILNRQNWITGLLPASTAVTAHGDYTDAWVRDNVYSILAAWGLGLAYRKQAALPGCADRAYLLEQSTVKLMRGLLISMMRQAPKVEKFKNTQNPLDCLHAKYNTQTGDIVVGDGEWGHLQLDATSIFLLMLAQMTASGLRIVFSVDEVNFVQNLVHYISRAYRTPDYGIWERGDKMNHGIAELNASSIGMAKAALEAMSGCNLFANHGQTAVIHVIADDIARTRIALESLLPRESLSKEIDSALLSITGFPAFAIDNQELRARTQGLIVSKLQGRYGCKRFLLDGHQTVLEDHHRLHYEEHELKQFMHIECEWPLFFSYLWLNHQFAGDTAAAKDYQQLLKQVLVEKNGQRLLPELYIVPREAVEAEKRQPHSQTRIPNENIPLVWAQSLYILGGLLSDGLISSHDIDPLERHKPKPAAARQILVALLAEDDAVQQQLKAHGAPAQTRAEIAPIQIRDASELAEAYTQVGRNDRIGLGGRPLRMLRPLATSRLYRLSGQPTLFLPQFMDQKGFYIALDNRLIIQRLRLELNYIKNHWDSPMPPLLVIPVKPNMLQGDNRQVLLDFIAELQRNNLPGLNIELGLIEQAAERACTEKIDYLHDFSFRAPEQGLSLRQSNLPPADAATQPIDTAQLTAWEIGGDSALLAELKQNGNLYAQMELLILLCQRHGSNHEIRLGDDLPPCRVGDLLEEVYQRAGDRHIWQILRRTAGKLEKYDINLEQSATEILVRQHGLTVGHAYSGKATLRRPTDSWEILKTIRDFNPDIAQHIIFQELIIYLGMLIKTQPELFTDLQTIRIGHILQLIIARQKRRTGSQLDQAFNEILALAPHQLAELTLETLSNFSQDQTQLGDLESLHYEGPRRQLEAARFPLSLNPKDRGLADDWHEWREQQGGVGRENEAFYSGVWTLLQRSHGIIIGEKTNSKRRLDSESILAKMTPGEQSFKILVNHLLNKIEAPIYRQLTVEALRAVALIFQDNPELHLNDAIYIDVLIGHAVRQHWLHMYPEHHSHYGDYVSLAWQAFYQLPPHAVANSILDALIYLLKQSTPA